MHWRGCSRGALGDERSSVDESFGDGLLDWPHYTRPEPFAHALPQDHRESEDLFGD